MVNCGYQTNIRQKFFLNNIDLICPYESLLCVRVCVCVASVANVTLPVLQQSAGPLGPP